MLQLEGKVDVVLEQLCIRFSKDVETQFYTDMNLLFARLGDVEERMKEVAVQVSSGSFGSKSNNLDLNVEF